MAIARVQKADSGAIASSTSKMVAYGSNNTAGNMLVVFISNAGTSVPGATITDTLGNTWTLLQSDLTLNGFVQALWVAYNCKVGANTVTVSWSTGAVNNWMAIAEYSGLTASSAALDQSGKTTGSGNWSSSSLTTTGSNELLLLFVGNAADSLTLTGGGFTSEATGIFSGSEYNFWAEQIVSSKGTYQGSGAGSGNYVTFLVTFFEATPIVTASGAVVIIMI